MFCDELETLSNNDFITILQSHLEDLKNAVDIHQSANVGVAEIYQRTYFQFSCSIPKLPDRIVVYVNMFVLAKGQQVHKRAVGDVIDSQFRDFGRLGEGTEVVEKNLAGNADCLFVSMKANTTHEERDFV